MKTTYVLLFALSAAVAAHADFSYTTARTSTGPASGAAPQTGKRYYKGQKMRIDRPDSSTIIDFDAQTITRINNAQKSYSVMKFSDLAGKPYASEMDVKADFKKTGETKTINGHEASEAVMTMEMDMPGPQGQQPGMKMQAEVDTWISSGVPGSDELRAFYKRNRDHFPWAAMAAGGNPSLQKAMADMQRKMADLNGVPVLQVVKVKSAGPGGAQAAQLAQARAKLEELQKQGGPAAAAVAQALARMGGATGGASLFETTEESTEFSTDAIPESVFAIPAGFHASDK